MIEELVKISAIISEKWFTRLHELCIKPGFKHTGYYGCIDLIKELSIEFYKQYEYAILDDKYDWTAIINSEEVNEYAHLIEKWTKTEILFKYEIQL